MLAIQSLQQAQITPGVWEYPTGFGGRNVGSSTVSQRALNFVSDKTLSFQYKHVPTRFSLFDTSFAHLE